MNTIRISKNLIRGKAFTYESFQKAFHEGGHSAWSKFMGLKPVSVFAFQQWRRLTTLIETRAIYETDLVHQHLFGSYDEMVSFFRENYDMIQSLDDNIVLSFEVKGSFQPARTKVKSVKEALRKVNSIQKIERGPHV